MAKHLKGILAAVAAAATLAAGVACPAWAETMAPDEIQPGAQTAPLDGMAVDHDGNGDGREADSTSNLALSGADASAGRLRAMARSAPSGGTLAEGHIMNGVHDIEDPATSIYVGGNMTYLGNMETEGSVVVDGDMLVGDAMGQGLLAGRAMWGMGFTPPAGADMLAVGGRFVNHSGTNPQWVGGAARIGGKATWGDGSTTNRNNNRPLYIATKTNLTNMGYAADSSVVRHWAYQNLPSGTAVSTGLGRSSALKVDRSGRGDVVDYNGYVSSTLKPLSSRLKGLKANGAVSYGKKPAYTHQFYNRATVSASNDGKIVFTGNGKAERQVFTLDLGELYKEGTSRGVNQWSLDFKNVPDGQAIVINAVNAPKGSDGRRTYTWSPGWKVMVNGKDYSTYINSCTTEGGTAGCDSWSRFRDISSRIMWNFPDTDCLKLDYAHGTFNADDASVGNADMKGRDVFGSFLGKGVLFPGSILLPNGSMTDYADTNGRILVGGNLDFVVWEHHNAPWVGFDEPQRFTVRGSTRAQAPVAYGGTQAVSDRVTLNSTGADGKGRTVYDLSVSGLKATLSYRDSSGKVTTSRPKALPAARLARDGTRTTVDTPAFAPSDVGLERWLDGDYWFDIQGGDAAITDASAGTKATLTKTGALDGSNDDVERFRVERASVSLSVATKASTNGAGADNRNPVSDSVTLTNSGKTAVKVAKATVTLNYPGYGGVKSASKTITDVTVPAGGSKTVSSPAFAPSDLKFAGNWHSNLRQGDRYWFDIKVDPADVTTTTGDKVTLTTAPSHDGKSDTAEQFQIVPPESAYSTKAAGTFSTPGGTTAVRDDITLSFEEVPTLRVTSTLNWAADASATKADATQSKSATLKAKATSAGPSFTPSDFGWKTWRAGRYWYDLVIPAQTGCPEGTQLPGLQSSQAAERWTAVNQYTLDLAKLAYIGQPGQGRWSNEPVKGAVFTLTETAGQNGSTAKPGTTPKTVTTDANGSTHLLDGTIGATDERWFVLMEVRTPTSYEEPGSGTYWTIHVKGGVDKATVTVTGSNAEAKALIKGQDGSTVTVGNRLVPGAMMPLTGGRFDVARAAALAGMVTLGLLIAGCWNLRRKDTHPAGRD